MKALILCTVLLTGCGSFGTASYELVPTSNGLYGLKINDGKEYAGRVIQFESTKDGTGLVIQEGASKAFKGQGIAAKAMSVLPVTGLDALTK